jgi:YD repeat-containing protein
MQLMHTQWMARGKFSLRHDHVSLFSSLFRMRSAYDVRATANAANALQPHREKEISVMRDRLERTRIGMVAVGAIVASLAIAMPATAAETVVYLYDELGRISVARYPDGKEISYQYDATGNRTSTATTLVAAFNQTIQVPASVSVNLRSLANAAGYTGAQAATITFQVASGVTVSGAGGSGLTPNGGPAIDTGTWPTDTYPVTLTLQVTGTVRGGGGKGGNGGTISGAGAVGGVGGDAVYCQVPIDITVTAGGYVQSGGGGGGGGGGKRVTPPPEPSWRGGGGGGGGYPNGAGGNGGGGDAGYGAPGSTPGAGGATATVGGAGGNYGAGGGTGGNGGTGGGVGGAGGATGYAIRKNGHTVNVTNNGTVTGTIG